VQKAALHVKHSEHCDDATWLMDRIMVAEATWLITTNSQNRKLRGRMPADPGVMMRMHTTIAAKHGGDQPCCPHMTLVNDFGHDFGQDIMRPNNK
jgi:hypothetical protein